MYGGQFSARRRLGRGFVAKTREVRTGLGYETLAKRARAGKGWKETRGSG
jgi:hypothetical protein